MLPRVVPNGPGPFRDSHGTPDLGRDGLPERMMVEWRTEGREGINQTKKEQKSVQCGRNCLAIHLCGQDCRTNTRCGEEASTYRGV